MDLKNQSKRITPYTLPKSIEKPMPATADEKIASLTEKLEQELVKAQNLTKQLQAQRDEFEKTAKDFNTGLKVNEEQKASIQTAHKDKTQLTKERLAAQPKIEIFIPGEPKEAPGSTLPVTIDGYRVNVPKNVYVKVPEQIADIIKEHLNQSVAALRSPLSLDIASEEKQNNLNL